VTSPGKQVPKGQSRRDTSRLTCERLTPRAFKSLSCQPNSLRNNIDGQIWLLPSSYRVRNHLLKAVFVPDNTCEVDM
jgi:hypothetical protein